MRGLGRTFASLCVSLSLIGSSTAAIASAPAAQAPAPNAWLALSALTPSGAAVLGAGAAVAAQPETPPPPPEGYSSPRASDMLPLFIALGAVLILDIYLLSQNHHHHRPSVPNSPA